MKTKIIAIEGIDGSGKTVQIELLQKKLLERGYSVSIRSYPVYSSFFGSQVGLLLSGSGGIKATDVDQKSMAMWFALDRFDDFKSFVDGDADFLLINRYVLSNAVYQSIRDGDWDKPDIVDWVFELEYNKLGLPRPELNLFFDVDTDCAGHNVDKKGFRDYIGSGRDVYESSLSSQQRGRNKYIEIALRFDNIEIIKCTQDGTMLAPEHISECVVSSLIKHGII